MLMTTELAHILEQTEESYKGIHPGVEAKLDGWEKWYAQWLLTLVDLESLVGVRPSQVTLEKLLLHCDQDFTKSRSEKSWADFVAHRMAEIIAKHLHSQKQLTD